MISTYLSTAAAPRGSEYASPASLVVIIGIVVFLLEVLEPILFGLLPKVPERREVLIDGRLMIAVLSPLLDVLVIRRMEIEILGRRAAEDELRSNNFDAASHRCVYVNDRIRDLLQFDPDAFAIDSGDLVRNLVSKADRERFAGALAEVVSDPSAGPASGRFGFLTSTGALVNLVVGVTALDTTSSGQVRNLLMTAMPAVA